MTKEQEIEYLANTMWQLLDDMKSGQSVCLVSKAEARIAYEPFRGEDDPMADIMTLEEAKAVMAEC